MSEEDLHKESEREETKKSEENSKEHPVQVKLSEYWTIPKPDLTKPSHPQIPTKGPTRIQVPEESEELQRIRAQQFFEEECKDACRGAIAKLVLSLRNIDVISLYDNEDDTESGEGWRRLEWLEHGEEYEDAYTKGVADALVPQKVTAKRMGYIDGFIDGLSAIFEIYSEAEDSRIQGEIEAEIEALQEEIALIDDDYRADVMSYRADMTAENGLERWRWEDWKMEREEPERRLEELEEQLGCNTEPEPFWKRLHKFLKKEHFWLLDKKGRDVFDESDIERDMDIPF